MVRTRQILLLQRLTLRDAMRNLTHKLPVTKDLPESLVRQAFNFQQCSFLNKGKISRVAREERYAHVSNASGAFCIPEVSFRAKKIDGSGRRTAQPIAHKKQTAPLFAIPIKVNAYVWHSKIQIRTPAEHLCIAKSYLVALKSTECNATFHHRTSPALARNNRRTPLDGCCLELNE